MAGKGDIMKWYAIVAFGSPDSTVAARFPARKVGHYNEVSDALDAWRERAGHLAGTAEAACSVRIAGPFRTRAEARNADISE